MRDLLEILPLILNKTIKLLYVPFILNKTNKLLYVPLYFFIFMPWSYSVKIFCEPLLCSDFKITFFFYVPRCVNTLVDLVLSKYSWTLILIGGFFRVVVYLGSVRLRSSNWLRTFILDSCPFNIRSRCWFINSCTRFTQELIRTRYSYLYGRSGDSKLYRAHATFTLVRLCRAYMSLILPGCLAF